MTETQALEAAAAFMTAKGGNPDVIVALEAMADRVAKVYDAGQTLCDALRFVGDCEDRDMMAEAAIRNWANEVDCEHRYRAAGGSATCPACAIEVGEEHGN